MKKNLLTMLLVGASALALAPSLQSCSSGAKIKIGVGLYQDSGAPVTALKNFLEGISNDVNCEFTYVTLGFDEAENKTKLQSLMSSGVKGIISTMDSATEAVLKDCEKANIYYGGYLCDFDASLDKVKDNPYFVGTAVDGAYNGNAWGKEVAQRMIADGMKNIGMVKFPAFAYPHQQEMEDAFRAEIAEYNKTAAEADKITVQAESTVLMFTNLANTYFNDNPNIDSIYGMCGGIDNIYPVLRDNNKTNIKLYTAGFSKESEITSNFGTSGNGCLQEMVYSNVEAVVYPLVQILNKIDGKTFADQPTSAKREDVSQIKVRSNADLSLVLSKSIMATGNYSDAFLTGAQVKALLAKNGGTYANLVNTVNSMAIEDLGKKN